MKIFRLIIVLSATPVMFHAAEESRQQTRPIRPMGAMARSIMADLTGQTTYTYQDNFGNDATAPVMLLKPQPACPLSPIAIEVLSTAQDFNRKSAPKEKKLKELQQEEALAVEKWHIHHKKYQQAHARQERAHLRRLIKFQGKQQAEKWAQTRSLIELQAPSSEIERVQEATEKSQRHALEALAKTLAEERVTDRNAHNRILYLRGLYVTETIATQNVVRQHLARLDQENKARLARNEALHVQSLKRQRRS